jgi:alpha-1,2-mannosyltransferase
MRKPKLLTMFYYFIFSINTGIFLAYLLLGISAAKNNLFLQADLTSHYTAWKMIQDGHKSWLYDLELQQQYQKRILVDRSFSDGLLTYNYPPYTALLFSFLNRFSLIGAFYIWMLFQSVFLILFFITINNNLKSFSKNEKLLIYTAILAFPPLFFNFMVGAFSLLMSLGTIKVYENFKSNKQRMAGIWWLLLANKPQFGLFPVIIFLITKRWRALVTIIISSFLIFLLTSYDFGIRIWKDYLFVLIKSGTQFGTLGIDPKGMYNFKAVLTLGLGIDYAKLINILSWIFFILSVFIIIIIWQESKWDPQNPVLELKYSITLTLFIFSFPHVNAHDSLLLIPAALLFLIYLINRNLSITFFSIFIFSLPIFFLFSKFLDQIRIITWIPPLSIAFFLIWQIRFWVIENQKQF